MSRRRQNTGVRGPNSALTEFLRVEGITDTFRQRRARQPADASSTPDHDANSSRFEIQSADASLETSLDASGDENDEAYPELFSTDELKELGQENTCVNCGNPFTLTVYSRFIEDPKGYICEDCNEVLRKRERSISKTQTNARKRRKKAAKALLDRTTVRLSSLQDVCIKTISSHIDAVDALGDIGQNNINKILKILSKNRSLTDFTVTLFLNPSIKVLELWDCSNVTSDSFNKIAAYCSQLESLTLFMCGQLHDDNMTYFIDKLPHLTKLALNSPFLVSKEQWVEYFEQTTSPLREFEVRNTHRFGSESLMALLEKKGAQMTLLKLSRLDGLDSQAVYELIPQYLSLGKLELLELSYPHSPDLVHDDLLIHILATTGETVRHLNVDGCTQLTDRFLVDAVAKFCPVLETLSMRGLELVTNEGMRDAFVELAEINYGGLLSIDLARCTGLGNEAVEAVLKHSGKTLVEISLNSVNGLTNSFLLQILTEDADESKARIRSAIENGVNDGFDEENELGEETAEDFELGMANGSAPKRERVVLYQKIALPLLTKMDAGFVRAFDDCVLRKLSEQCPKLAIVEVFGDNRCTEKANVRSDLLVIGIQGGVL